MGDTGESPSPRKALATRWAQEALAKRSVFSAYLTFAGENSRGESWVQSENPGFYTPAELENYIQTVLETLEVQSWEEVASQKVLILRNSNIGIDRIEGFIHHSSSNAMVFSEI